VLLPEGLDAYSLNSSISRAHSHAADKAPAAAAEGSAVEGVKAAMAKLHAKLVAIAKGAGTHAEEQHKEYPEQAEGHPHHHEHAHAHSDEGHNAHEHEHKD